MPVEYSGIRDEHFAVRTSAGIFDVSHMGEIEIAGSDALRAIQTLTSNDASRLSVGKAQYSVLTTAGGTVVDDLLVYRLAEEHFMFVVNAANVSKDYKLIVENVKTYSDAVAVNVSNRYALLALQGPKATKILQTLTNLSLDSIEYYRFETGEIAGVRCTVSRTGYTGEDGFELFASPQTVDALWLAITEAGRETGLRPVGLGARDTLRLEAGMRLCGQDMDENTSLLEAGLEWIIDWDKGNFIGREALVAEKERGPSRQLVGFEMLERGIARSGHDVYADSDCVGRVTSGTLTPFLGKAVGMAFLPTGLSTYGTEFTVDVRGRRLRAKVVKMPFYKRTRS